MNRTLVLLLAAPLQSWGERALFSRRDTLTHPTRSGVIGLLACALGEPRGASLDWAEDLVVHVRADSPGSLLRDFHTVGGGYPLAKALRTASGGQRTDRGRGSGILTERWYLTDAAFTVTVTGGADLVDRLADAVARPRWPLFLGRKACPPAHSVLLGVTDAPAEWVLEHLPTYTPAPRARAQGAPEQGTADGASATRDAQAPPVTQDLAAAAPQDDDPVDVFAFLDAQTTTGAPSADDVDVDFFDAITDLPDPAPTSSGTDPAPVSEESPPTGPGEADGTGRLGPERTIYLDGVDPTEASETLRDTPASYDAEARTYRTRHVGADVVSPPAAGTGVRAWTTMRDALASLTTSGSPS